MGSKKKRKRGEKPTIHPQNKYSDNPPDFALLASLYHSFEPYVFYTRDGRPRIDWTDFNATRELTRVLLLHDHRINWWIPDGQLCPTVPNRSNYIHWVEDLLSSEIIPNPKTDSNVVRGFDIGTGANCIYPLLGASLLHWSFVGSDVTDVALEWAERNVKNNPQICELIEIRKVENIKTTFNGDGTHNGQWDVKESSINVRKIEADEPEPSSPLSSLKLPSEVNKSYNGPPILIGVVRDDEKFDFCMCNPPFFETMEEAGLNPKTSCGGTPEEMVCPGGEHAFINRIVEDSVKLKQSFRWYTSMVGRKSNLKTLISKLREVGVTIVKTTEFVQGQTCRWGLAWSFVPPVKNIISSHVAEKSVMSFMLEGLHRHYSAIHVLQSVESFFCTSGASSKLDTSSFTVDVVASSNQCDTILKNEVQNSCVAANCQSEQKKSNGSNSFSPPLNDLCFRVSIFQQIPGTLLVTGSLNHKERPQTGAFSMIFQRLGEVLKGKFCREKGPDGCSS